MSLLQNTAFVKFITIIAMAFVMALVLYGPINTIIGLSLPVWILVVLFAWLLMQFWQGTGALENRQSLPFSLIPGDRPHKSAGAAVLLVGTVILTSWWFGIIKENDMPQVIQMGVIIVLMMLGLNYLGAHFVNPKLAA